MRLTTCVAAACVALLALAAAAPSWWNGFVYDDAVYVAGNPVVTGRLSAWEAFTTSYPPGRSDQGLYRPLTTLSFRLDAQTWGAIRAGEWNGFHFTNSLLHAACATLLFALARRLGLGRIAAGCGAAWFATSPAISETFFWISARAALLAAIFTLIAALAATAPAGRWRAPAAFLAWIAALLSKENAVAAPFLIAALWAFFPALPRPPRGARLPLAAAVLGVFAAFALIRVAVLGHATPTLTAFTGVVDVFSRLWTSLALGWRYLFLWFLPFDLTVQHDLAPIESAWKGLALAGAWAILFWITWRKRARFPWLGGALAWFAIALLPVANLLIPIGAVFTERFLYLPSALLGPACVAMLTVAARRVGSTDDVARKAGGILAPVFGAGLILCWVRAQDWQDNLTLWEAALRVAPESFPARAAAADALFQRGRFAEAHLHASGALRRLEGQPEAYRRLFVPKLTALDAAAQAGMRHTVWQRRFAAANAAARALRFKEALGRYRALVEAWPERPETQEALGDLYVRMANPVAARQCYLEALNLGANTPALHAKYGQVLSVLGSKAEAIMAYDAALRADPSDAITHYNRGVALADLGDLSEALAAFREASRHAPKLIAPRLNAAGILVHRRDWAAAREEIARVLEVDPKQQDAISLLKKIPADRP
ncbi:MAG: tetratricopeptide repeat protein [Verrucomicrobiae bacterium]|nr:tetratricopeptide repeat protein [Verrucomicrobiae bacterium]